MYLLYLAYQISKFRLSKEQYNSKKISFTEYFSFQFMNPKLYIFATTTSVMFTNYTYSFYFEILIITLVMGAFTLLAITTWVFAGNIFLNIFKNDKQRKIINYFLSFCLLITAIWIIFT